METQSVNWLTSLGKYVFQSVTLLAALLFFIGWSYGSQYYNYFGITQSLLGIAPTSYLAWGTNVIIANDPIKIYLIGVLILTALVSATIPLYKEKGIIDSFVLPMVLALSYLTLIYCALFLAIPNETRAFAQSQAELDSGNDSTLSDITIELANNDAIKTRFKRQYGITSGQYNYIGLFGSHYYFFKPVPKKHKPKVIMLSTEHTLLAVITRIKY